MQHRIIVGAVVLLATFAACRPPQYVAGTGPGSDSGRPSAPSVLRMINGFLEVYYMGEWRSVCDDGFDLADANVACRQLGYDGAESFAIAVSGTNDRFWLDDLACTGRESSLDQCPSSGWGNENCARSESVSVICR